MNKLGEQLYNFRKKRELSQQQMAYLLGIHRTYYTEIENGRKIPGVETVKAIKNLFEKIDNFTKKC